MEPKRIDETVPGGRYLVNGEWVDAEGKPVDAPKTPAKAKAEPKANETPNPDDPNAGTK